MAKSDKTKNISVKKSSNLKINKIRKPVLKVPLKRLLMVQRRLDSILDEQQLWEEKNKELLDSLTAEKMLNASLRKESFHWQRLYHESTVKINSYKVKQAEISKELSGCLREIDLSFPHMVALTQMVTTNKVRLSNILKSMPSSEYECLPRQFRGHGKPIEDSGINMEKPTKHRVGPMVRGHLITKPKILLERLMLPQLQDSEPANNNVNSTIEENHQLTPIPEENDQDDVVHMEHISIRPKRKLGRSSWRLRRQEKIDKERERTRINQSPAAVAYDGDSSDTDSNPTTLNNMEPVVLFKDVSRMLQNSTLLKVNSGRSGDTDGGLGSHSDGTIHLPATTTTAEDPLEGSSWMFNNNLSHRTTYGPPKSNKRSSLYKDSSEDDDYEEMNIVVQNNISNSSCMDTLTIKNHQRSSVCPEMSIRFSSDTSNDSLKGSPTAEPDSTINLDVLPSKSGSDSSDVSLVNKSSYINHLCQKTSSTENTFSVTIPMPVVRLSSTVECPTQSKRSSSIHDNCIPTQYPPECLGKRIRRKKTHLYPGEEILSTPKETKHTSPPGKKNDKKSTNMNLKKRSSTKEDLNKKNDEGVASKGVKKKKNENGMAINRKTMPKKRFSSGGDLNMKVDDGVTTNIVKKKKKISEMSTEINTVTKKSSLEVENSLRTSSRSGSFDSDNGHSFRSRRTKTQVCYKELSMNVKLRRP